MKLTKKAVYSHLAQELNETMKHLQDLSPQFNEYMSKNWYPVNKVGVLLSRKIFSQCSTIQPTGLKLIKEY